MVFVMKLIIFLKKGKNSMYLSQLFIINRKVWLAMFKNGEKIIYKI